MNYGKQRVKNMLARAGLEVSRSAYGSAARREHLLTRLGTRMVIDVGANVGQYGHRLRAGGYQGEIVSFEPQPGPYRELVAGLDADWKAHNVALGAEAGRATLMIAEASDCSSFLPTSAAMAASYSPSQQSDSLEVDVATLDSYSLHGNGLLVKIDTQGFEHQVLAGAGETVGRAQALEIEMALVETYEGGSTIYSLLPLLHAQGFVVVSVANGFTDSRSMQTLDIDVLMIRP